MSKTLKTIKRLAAKILDAGESRIRILDQKKAMDALTGDDVRGLIKEGVIVLVPKKGVGRSKAADKAARKRSGRRRGTGSRRGSANLSKQMWMRKIRALRRVLKQAKPTLVKGAYGRVYERIKGNAFRDKKHLREYLREKKLVK
ncbi:50S ribosomal protein L19e [Candidatus Micrarchaeota archaeon CG08_land_8_20_14_0_20_59_11]|nr:MAG: 50S ribosomal protein L19e [Candidatus Micrarchaeota archaeon CG08_land_8_20_14_0_20_59_11]